MAFSGVVKYERFWWILILAAIGQVSSLKKCSLSFLGKCTCDYQEFENRQQFVVNCTNSGFYDTDILAQLPPETQVLIFTGNHIPEVPWNIFGTLNELPKLRVVDMSNNEIKEIRGKSYHHVQNVERLILNHNELVISVDESADENLHHPRVFSNFVNLLELHLTNAFKDYTDDTLSDDLHDIFIYSNLSRLMKLHLEQNEIMYFKDRQIFCDLPNLRDLHLGDNKLKKIDFNISCLKHLRFLDLEGNSIETIPKKELDLLDRINNNPKRDEKLYIDIRGNNFKCDCSVHDLVTWLAKTSVHVRGNETLRCARPKRTQGTLFSKLNTMKCPSEVKRVTSARQAVFFIFMAILLSLAAWAGLMVYRKRKSYMALLSRKVTYTTIKDEDGTADIL